MRNYINTILLILLSISFLNSQKIRLSSSSDEISVPVGMVSFFFSPNITCPDNWKEAQYASGRLIMGVTDPQLVGTTIGTAIKDRTVPTHDHTFTGNIIIPDKSSATVGGSNKGVGQKGTYPIRGTTGLGGLELPFVQIKVCEYFGTNEGNTDAFPYQSISFFNKPGCPSGWSPAPNQTGRFILPTIGSDGNGFVSKEVWNPSSPPKHVHTILGDVAITSKGFVAGWGANPRIADPGTFLATGATGDNLQPVLPYVNLLACQKTEMSNGEKVPKAISMFFGGVNCPTGWDQALTTGGRFIFGLPGLGVQLAAFWW